MKGFCGNKEWANFPLIDTEKNNCQQRKLNVTGMQNYRDNFPEILWDANEKAFENQYCLKTGPYKTSLLLYLSFDLAL